MHHHIICNNHVLVLLKINSACVVVRHCSQSNYDMKIVFTIDAQKHNRLVRLKIVGQGFNSICKKNKVKFFEWCSSRYVYMIIIVKNKIFMFLRLLSSDLKTFEVNLMFKILAAEIIISVKINVLEVNYTKPNYAIAWHTQKHLKNQ